VGEQAIRHVAEERLGEPASYLTIERGDRVYDLYGWAAGRVAEPRIVASRDEFFDGVVVAFRGRRVFVDAPEVRAIHDGVVLLDLTVADLARTANDATALPPAPSEPAASDDAVALMGSVTRMYVAGRLSLGTLEHEVERVLAAQTRADLDAIARELLANAPAQRAAAS
jgi:hypothetical protein